MIVTILLAVGFVILISFPLRAGTAEPDTLWVIHKPVALGEVSVSTIKGGDHPNADDAVTYINAEAVSRYDLVNLREASALAPNFFVPAYGSRMTSSIYLRGLGTRIDQPAVGLNVDNIPIVNKDNFDSDLWDIDRIEIMRGPQNILYGRNTMGGLVNIYTLSPFNFEGVRARVSYGSQDSYRMAAGVYGMLTETLGMSLSGDLNGTDGFHTNRYNNTRCGVERMGSMRWKTALRPKQNVLVENVAMISNTRQHGYPYRDVARAEIAYNDTCYYKRFSFVDGLTVKHSLGEVTFSSIISAQYLDDDMTLDQDFTTDRYFTLQQKRREWAFTADFVARGKQTGRYSWLAGAFGMYRRTRMDAPVHFFDDGIQNLIIAHRNDANPHYPVAWDDDNFLLASHFTMPSGGLSAYHESTLRLGDFTLTGALRLDWERTSLDYHSWCRTSYTIFKRTPAGNEFFDSRPIDIDRRGDLTKDYLQLLPKLSVGYRLPAEIGNLYASATKGYKSGGYNTQMFSDFLQQQLMEKMGMTALYDVEETTCYKPETDWNVEAGAHLWFLDRRLSLDLAAFYILIDNQQVTTFPAGSVTGRLMTNAGRSRSRGVEVSTSYTDPWGWYARASYGLTDARFTRYDNGRADFSGHHIPYAPCNTLFLGAGLTRGTRGFFDSISFDLSARGAGRIYWDEANDVSQPFYMTLNASLRGTHDKFALELWADNITHTRYDTFYFVSMGNRFLQQGNGVSFGATLTYQVEFY